MAQEPFESWDEIPNDPQYRSLKRTSRRIVAPLTIAFLVIYGVYVLGAVYASETVARHHIGGLSIAWILALIVNAMPIMIAVVYSRLADQHLEPTVAVLKERIDGGAEL